MRTPSFTSKPAVALAAMTLLVLTGCSAGTGTSGDEGTPPADAEVPCLVGTWNLDVPDYEAQTGQYLLETGIPIVEYAMTGSGEVTFTADGSLSTDINLLVDAVMEAGGTRVLIEQSSVYTGSGDWADGAAPDTIDLTNWASVQGLGAADSSDGALPPVTFFDIPSLTAVCTADTLTLQGPDAPFSSNWTR
jgi:hypothetical protein